MTRMLPIVLLLSLPAPTLFAADEGELAVGMPAEHTLVTALLRLAALAWGLVLLGIGPRLDRAVVGTFVGTVGVALGAPLAGHGYALTILVTLATLAAGLAVYLVAPRVVLGVACIWPLPAVYAAHLQHTGSFERSAILALLLAIAGVVLGASWPSLGVVVLSASLGTVLIRLASPVPWSFWFLVALPLAVVVGQSFLLFRRRGRLEWGTITGSAPTRRQLWRRSFTAATCAFMALVAAVFLLSPVYGSGVGPNPHRLDALVAGGELDRPGLVFTAEDNFYLSGRPLPIALVSHEPRFVDRLAGPLVGRSPIGPIHDLRAVKQEDELQRMRRAAAITSAAFSDLRPLIRPGSNEGEVEARILESFRDHGATGVAFSSVVASGSNAVLPHYMRNDSTMTEGLVVIDIGCSVDGYASDMTRTFPVSGETTEAERHLYRVVLDAGDAARAILRAGVTMRELDDAAREVIDEAGFGPFFTHSIGHHVGLDVHDPHRRSLSAGMVITIEPGIYIPRGADVDPAYWSLGIRIEDSYVVTEQGHEEITDYPRLP